MTDTSAHPAEDRSDLDPLAVFKRQLDKVVGEITNLDPKKQAAMKNAAMVAVMNNFDLLRADRQALFSALRLCADYGIVPNGIEGTLQVKRTKVKDRQGNERYIDAVKFMPMVRGIINRVQRSGQIDTLWAEVVYEGEKLVIDQTQGDRRPIHDFDPLSRGPDGQARQEHILGAYAVARYGNGTIDCEAISTPEIMKIRAVATTKNVWDSWFAEKSKVAAIRRLSKRLPLSAEDQELIRLTDDADLAQAVALGLPKSKFQLRAERARAAAQLAAPQATIPITPEVEPQGVTIDHAETPEDRRWTQDEPAEFNAATPEFEDGQAAFAAGASATTCPYPKGSDRAVDWCAGWHDARRAAS